MGLGAQGSEHAKVRLRRSGRGRLLGVRARARVQVRGRGRARARARARVGDRVGFRVRVSMQRRRLLGGLSDVRRVSRGDVALEHLEQQLLRVG